MSKRIQNTRWTILELLKKRGTLSVSQIAEELNLHSMSIRQHLIALENEGYVDYQQVRIPKGRPHYLYALTENGSALFPNNYEQFTLTLLDGVLQLEGEAKLTQLLQAQMESVLEGYQQKLAGQELGEQVKILAELLNQAGYMVEWDGDAEGFIIREHHCAIGAIADKYPQVCAQELNLMRTLLDTEVERLDHKAKGDCHCSYRIARRPER